MYEDEAFRLSVLQPCTHAVASRNCLSYLRCLLSFFPSEFPAHVSEFVSSPSSGCAVVGESGERKKTPLPTFRAFFTTFASCTQPAL